MNSVLLPKITALAAINESSNSISKLFIRIGRLQYFIVSYVLVGFVIFGKEFIILWGGESYIQTYYVSLIILIPFSFDLISNVGIVVLQATNKLKYRSLPMLIGAIVGFVFTFPFTKEFGLYGCVWTVSFSILLSNVIASNIVFYCIAKIDVIKYWGDIFKMMYLPIIAICLFTIFKNYISLDTWLSLCFAIVVFLIIYTPLLCLTCMNKEERQYFNFILKRWL